MRGVSARTAGLSVLFVAVAAGGAPAQSSSMDGVWRSQGYGNVFEIHGPALNAFEVTNTTCVAGGTAAVDTTEVPGRMTTFRTPDGSEMFVRPGGSADHKLLHREGSASDERIDRIPRLPAACVHPTENTPAGNFEVFAQTWAEHYISFDLKKTDWSAVVAANRSKVTSSTTPAELFDIFEKMIAPFGDTHTFLSAPEIERRFQALRPGTDRVVTGGFQAFRSGGMAALLGVTDRAYLKGALRTFCNDQIQYGHIDEATGYLRILSFSNYAPKGGFAAGLAALEAALDDIFSDRALAALVIDVRINSGGADPYGLAIASRLATGEYLAYTKEARADAIDRTKWTPGDRSLVRPSTRPGFHGPTVELIGPLTISAGETFTQALMGRTPHVTRIGENTQGVFSDVLGRRLPNGWRFGLPNEVFRTPQGTTFDGAGIPPDQAVPVFADADVAAGKDPGVARALEVLRRK
jgi:peptidase S41-like protein/tricorn protease-like protein